MPPAKKSSLLDSIRHFDMLSCDSLADELSVRHHTEGPKPYKTYCGAFSSLAFLITMILLTVQASQRVQNDDYAQKTTITESIMGKKP